MELRSPCCHVLAGTGALLIHSTGYLHEGSASGIAALVHGFGCGTQYIHETLEEMERVAVAAGSDIHGLWV